MKKQLSVEAIAHGTVIDHIPAGQGIKILKFFQLTDQQAPITVGLNLKTNDGSKSKDLIKVENTHFTEEQANQLALFAPQATINVIEDYEVVNKFRVKLPDTVSNVLSCPNSNCITHVEPVSSKFYISQQAETKLKCYYCEKGFSQLLFPEIV